MMLDGSDSATNGRGKHAVPPDLGPMDKSELSQNEVAAVLSRASEQALGEVQTLLAAAASSTSTASGKHPNTPLADPEPSVALSAEERIARLEAALDTAPLGLASLDLNLCFISVNQVFARMHGMQVQDFLGRTVAQALPGLAPQMIDHLERCLSSQATVQREVIVAPRSSGEPMIALRTCQPVYDAAGKLIGASTGLLDITERKQAELALQESADNYRHVVELHPHIPWSCTPDGSLVELSARWTELTGQAAGQVRGEVWIKSIHPLDLLGTLAAWRRSMETGDPFDAEYRVRSAAAGEWLWLRTRAAPRRGPGAEILRWYGILEDITERKRIDAALREKTRRLEAATEELALRVREDHLTGLANRRHFDDMLVRELLLCFRSKQPLVLIMIDVDRFKSFNDHYGHVAGDECLRRIGAMLRQSTRAPADTVARYGGEEFAIVLPNTTEEQAMVVAHRARDGARALELTHAGSSLGQLTISVGIAELSTVNSPGVPVAEVASALIEMADKALYAAKSAGRDRIVGSRLPLTASEATSNVGKNERFRQSSEVKPEARSGTGRRRYGTPDS